MELTDQVRDPMESPGRVGAHPEDINSCFLLNYKIITVKHVTYQSYVVDSALEDVP